MTNRIDVKIPKRAFNRCYLPLLENDNRYLVLYGGAGSGKSYFAAERFLIKLLREPMCNLLVVRAVGNTNRDSTFALFKQVINKWGLSEYFKYNESDLRITCRLNQNSVIFKGLDNAEKLKSITFAKGELTDIWIEEATEIDESSFNQLDVRLRGKGTKKQITVTFNPIDVTHWLKKRFADRKDDNITFFHSTYKDNNFLDEEYIKLLESYRDSDPYYYMVYCLGQWGVYGKTIFDAQAVSERISTAPQPIKTGYFSYEDNGLMLSNIQWVEDKQGYISIYAEPQAGYPYVIGGDTSGEGSDNFTGQVIDNITGRQVAVLKHQFDEDLYARQMYCLGMHYNGALVGVESNFSTYPIKELQRLGYPNQYWRETTDKVTRRFTKSYGFKTTSSTRPVILAGLVKAVREDITLIEDSDTLGEMLTFVRNTKGRPEAMQGEHDDLIMALAIAHGIRHQQRYVIDAGEDNEDNDINNDYSDFLGYGG